MRAVKQQMPPELVNRLDEVLVFSPLSREAVHQIAREQLDDLAERMAHRGYHITVSEPVVDVVVDEGFSREYGARPLQRAIERLLVSPLAGLPAGHYRAELVRHASVGRRQADGRQLADAPPGRPSHSQAPTNCLANTPMDRLGSAASDSSWSVATTWQP